MLLPRPAKKWLPDAQKLGWSVDGRSTYRGHTRGVEWKIEPMRRSAGSGFWRMVWSTSAAAIDGVLYFDLKTPGGLPQPLRFVSEALEQIVGKDFWYMSRRMSPLEINDPVISRYFGLSSSQEIRAENLSPQLLAVLRAWVTVAEETARERRWTKLTVADWIIFDSGGLRVATLTEEWNPNRLQNIVDFGVTLALSLRVQPDDAPQAGLEMRLRSYPW